MNASEFNEAVKAVTVDLNPKDRRDVLIDLGGSLAVHLRVIGIHWELVVPVGRCQAHVGSGRRIEVRPSWRNEGMSALCIGDNASGDFRIRGYVEFPSDSDLKIEGVVE